MTTLVDTLDDTDVMYEKDELTPVQRAYWEQAIENAQYAPQKEQRYISLEDFGRELMDAVRSKI